MATLLHLSQCLTPWWREFVDSLRLISTLAAWLVEMTAITTLRSSIASALADNTKYSVFSFPPATPIANSVIVTPADPYITPTNNTQTSVAPMANFRLQILVPLLDNEGNLAGIEDDIVRVFNLLDASSIVFNVGSVSAPSVMSAASGDLLSVEIALSTLTEWS